jgi:hypothetical protein
MFTGGASPHKDEVMQTFAMIKPDCAHNKAEILERIKVLRTRLSSGLALVANWHNVAQFVAVGAWPALINIGCAWLLEPKPSQWQGWC